MSKTKCEAHRKSGVRRFLLHSVYNMHVTDAFPDQTAPPRYVLRILEPAALSDENRAKCWLRVEWNHSVTHRVQTTITMGREVQASYNSNYKKFPVQQPRFPFIDGGSR